MIILDLLINRMQEAARDTRSLIFMDDAYTTGRSDGLEEAIEIVGSQKEEFDNWIECFKSFLHLGYTVEEAKILADSSFIII